MSEPTPEAIEAGAKALERVDEEWGSWEEMARAALSAAAPYLIREAQAKALEDAADDLQGTDQPGAFSMWLRARAAAIRDGKP
jgi:hypothetical protein